MSLLLSATQRAAFERDGFLIVRGFAPRDELEALLAEARAQLQAGNDPIEYEVDVRYPGAPESREALGGATARRLLRAYDRHERFRRWATGERAVAVVRSLLAAPVLVQAHHNCVMTKQPRFSSDTGWHQDLRYWAYESPHLVNLWLALTPERRENGCLRVLPGTHHPVPDAWLDPKRFLRTDLPEVQAWLAQEQVVELDAGDLLVFHAQLFHAATRNYTDQAKLSLVFTYKDRENAPLPGTRSASLPEIALPN